MFALQDNGNGGEPKLFNGDLVVDNTVFSLVYLCLFGGNNDDKEYFGNMFLDQGQKVVSKTEKFLNEMIINFENLNKLIEVISDDIKRLSDDGIVDDFEINVEQLSVSKISIVINAYKEDRKDSYSFLFDKDSGKIESESS